MMEDITKQFAVGFNKSGGEELTSYMDRCGLTYKEASDPKDFLKKLQELPGSIAFIYSMGENGKVETALIKSLRNAFGKNFPVYVVVSENDGFLMPTYTGAGVTGFLIKPLTLKNISLIIGRHFVTPELAALALMADIPEEMVPVLLKPAPAQQAGLPADSTNPAIPWPQSAVFSVDSMKGEGSNEVVLPKILDWIFEKIFPAMATISHCLENLDLDEFETRIRFYESKMTAHSEYFVEMVNTLRRGSQDDRLDLLQAIRFYGLRNTKTLVVADRLLEATTGKGLTWSSRLKRYEEDPQKVLRFAKEALDHFGEDSLYREQAFNSGLVLDLLYHFASEAADLKLTIRHEIEISFKRALLNSDRCIDLAKNIKHFPLAKHIVTVNFFVEVGRICMGIFYKDYLELLRSFQRIKVRLGLQHIAEEKRYGLSSNVVGAMICQVTPGLAPVNWAVMLTHYPFMFNPKDEVEKALQALSDACNRINHTGNITRV